MTRRTISDPKGANVAKKQETQTETGRDVLRQLARIELASITAASMPATR